MKIIGKDGHDGFILTADRKEVARLIGFYYGGDNGCPELKVGMEITVAEMFQQLWELKIKENFLSNTAKEIRAYADLLEVKEPLIYLTGEELKEEPKG